jgi:hypothetical protein
VQNNFDKPSLKFHDGTGTGKFRENGNFRENFRKKQKRP